MSIQSNINQAITAGTALYAVKKGLSDKKEKIKAQKTAQEEKKANIKKAVELSRETMADNINLAIAPEHKKLEAEYTGQLKKAYLEDPNKETFAAYAAQIQKEKDFSTLYNKAMEKAKKAEDAKRKQAAYMREYRKKKKDISKIPVSTGGTLGEYPDIVKKAYLKAVKENGRK